MDFLRQRFRGWSDIRWLRVSRISTIGWAAILVGVAWLTREAQFVLNAAFSLRGLTSGALLGGLLLALFQRRVGARATVVGMLVSVGIMNLVYWSPRIEGLGEWWIHTFHGELFWPWFTLVGTLVTLGTARVAHAWLESGRPSQERRS